MAMLVAPYVVLWRPVRWALPLPLAFLPWLPRPYTLPPLPMSRGHRPPAPFSLQQTMSDRSTPSHDSPSPAPDTVRGGALRRGPFPMFLMDIAQSDDADRLLRELDMLKDDALEAADEAIRAPDPALSDLCDALRWTAADVSIQAITAVTGAWTPRGLLLTATVTVATSPSGVNVIEHVPLSLAQGGPLLEYVSKDPDALIARLATRWILGHAPFSAARLRHLVFRGLYTAREKTPASDTDVASEGLPQDSQVHQPVPAPPPQAVMGPPSDPRGGGGFLGTDQ